MKKLLVILSVTAVCITAYTQTASDKFYLSPAAKNDPVYIAVNGNEWIVLELSGWMDKGGEGYHLKMEDTLRQDPSVSFLGTPGKTGHPAGA